MVVDSSCFGDEGKIWSVWPANLAVWAPSFCDNACVPRKHLSIHLSWGKGWGDKPVGSHQVNQTACQWSVGYTFPLLTLGQADIG